MMLNGLWQDVRFSLRTLTRTPAFTCAAVVALALGIGANTAIFSVVHALILRPLPYPDANRLVMVWEWAKLRSTKPNVVAAGNYVDWVRDAKSFDALSAVSGGSWILTGQGEPEQLPAQLVTPNFFEVVRVPPVMGRGFEARDGVPNSPRVAILSDALWKRRFNADLGIVGKSAVLDGESTTIIGVMGAGFQFLDPKAELLTPLRLDPARDYRKTSGRGLSVIARVKSGVTVEAARAEMVALAARYERDFPEFDKNWGVQVVTLRDEISRDVKKPLFVLLGAVALVLLIACANVANLLLARATVRSREMAVRASLGASRMRITRQLLTESLMLALASGAMGAWFAVWGADALAALAPEAVPRLEGYRVDGPVLAFTLALAALTAIVFGLAPAMSAAKVNLADSLKEGVRTGSSAGKRRLRDAFVAAEVAIALVLLVGAGLLIQSFARLRAVHPGLDPSRVLTLSMTLPQASYGDDEKRARFMREAQAKLAAIPGVESASGVSFLPFSGMASGTYFRVEGVPAPEAGQEKVTVVRTVMPAYFRTMGIPVLRGREFTAADNAPGAPPRFVVSRLFAEQYLVGGDPVGKRISVHMARENPFGEVIGVVGDLKEGKLSGEPRPTAYYVHKNLAFGFQNFLLKAQGDPASLATAAVAAIRQVDPSLPVRRVRTMNEVLGLSVETERFQTVLVGAFGALALLLAAVGIYGVLSYSVAQRTREMALRVALGARPSQVVRIVVVECLALAGAGVVLGLAASAVAMRWLESLLHGIKPLDGWTYAGAAGLLLVVALMASLGPARRATSADPMTALRYE